MGTMANPKGPVRNPGQPHGRRSPRTALLAATRAAIPRGVRSLAAIAPEGRDQDIGRRHRPGFTRAAPTRGPYRHLFLRLPAVLAELGIVNRSLTLRRSRGRFRVGVDRSRRRPLGYKTDGV
jgi:hypothetical protein